MSKKENQVTKTKGASPLKARIARLEVRGFRSLQDVPLALPYLTVMIGANGAGKSNLIRFFEMLGWMLKGRNLGEFVEKYGGGDDQLFMGAKITPRMDALITIDSGQGLNEYRFGLAHATARDRLMFVDEAFRFSRHGWGTNAHWNSHEPGGTEAELPLVAGSQGSSSSQYTTARALVYLLRECATFQFHDTSDSAPIKLSRDITDCQHLRSNGGNLSAVLLYLQDNHRKRFDLIEREIARVLPSFGGFDLKPAFGKVQLRWRCRHSDKTFGAHLTSDGSLRLFCLMTLLNLPGAMLPDVILVDEPELGLHPAAIELISEMVMGVATERQIILSTQSPYLVDCFDLDSVVVANLVNGATRLERVDPDLYASWLEGEYQTSDLWLRNIIGGRP